MLNAAVMNKKKDVILIKANLLCLDWIRAYSKQHTSSRIRILFDTGEKNIVVGRQNLLMQELSFPVKYEGT